MNTNFLTRSRNTALFSIDQHNGLLLVWKVRQGIKRKVNVKTLCAFSLHEYENYLRKHFDEEQTGLFTILSKTDKLRLRAEDEHAILSKLMEQLGALILNSHELSRNDELALLECFITTLESHVRFEERVLFPYIQDTIVTRYLESRGFSRQTGETLSSETRWTDEFWLS